MKEAWYVSGADPEKRWPEFFATKMDAEMYARYRFPDESPDARYARVMYRPVWEEAELKGE